MLKYITILTLILTQTFFVLLLQAQGTTYPDPPDFRYVSVDSTSMTGGAILYWTPSPSANVIGYFIFAETLNVWSIHDTVWGRLTNSFLVPGSEPYRFAESYRICAFDDSMHRSSMIPLNGKHSTMYAFPYFDKCTESVLLDWNPYEGWDSIAYYNVYSKKQNAPYQFLAQVFGNQSSYLHDHLLSDIQYCYYVDAVHPDGRVSHSNQTCVVTKIPVKPSFLIADYASVTGLEQITVSFSIDQSAEINHYKLMRANSESGTYFQITTFPNTVASPIIYQDNNLEIKGSYCYKLIANDVCNRDIDTSNLACNMYLNASSESEMTYSLSWSKYMNFAGGIKKYNIYRIPYNYSQELIKTVDLSEMPAYEDDVSSYTYKQYLVNNRMYGKFCYIIEAVEDSSINPIHHENKSLSNKACDELDPRVFIPTCIYPNSVTEKNRIFLPYVIFPASSYSLIIYDRWGENIFETTDPFKGWDAKSKGGNFVSFGTYVYRLYFITADGKVYDRGGSFVVYYP